MMTLLAALIASSLMAVDVDGAAYTLYKKSMTWTHAKKECDKKGGQLATWSSDKEWKQIKKLHDKGKSKATWVGLTDRSSEGEWKFVDNSYKYCDNFGQNKDCDNLPQWARGEPTTKGSDDCAEINTEKGDKLNDEKCSSKRWFVCEFKSGKDKVSDTAPDLPQLWQPDGPVDVPGNYFVLDFASGQQGVLFVALMASNVIWMTIAVYYCCLFHQRKGKETYSKVVQFSEDERLKA